jgi:hypothetical protein
MTWCYQVGKYQCLEHRRPLSHVICYTLTTAVQIEQCLVMIFRDWFLPVKLIFPQVVQKFPAFYGTRGLIAFFARGIFIPIWEVCLWSQKNFILTTAAHTHVQIASNMFCDCGHRSGWQFTLQTLQDIAFLGCETVHCCWYVPKFQNTLLGKHEIFIVQCSIPKNGTKILLQYF